MQLTTVLQRLHKAGFCTAANLYDLTKAFDMLSNDSVQSNVKNDITLHNTARTLLLDMQGRLRIRMPVDGGNVLYVKLGAGVLQGGGTGPKLFRRVYDQTLDEWMQHAPATRPLTQVLYEGHHIDLSVSAYADDLARVEAGWTADDVEKDTLQHTDNLVQHLALRNLRLNSKKCESLLAIRGRGAYAASKRLHAGGWRGPPLKDVVRYLGAHVRRDGSVTAEITRRIAAAQAAFARFAIFFRRKDAPLKTKVMVFRAIVNETLLSALEVRVLPSSAVDRLEFARGLLFRRLFEKMDMER